MFETEKAKMIYYARQLDRYGLVALSGGNLTLRMDSGEILMTPSGMSYGTMSPEDIVVMDLEGNIIEGDLRPSVDNVAIRYILEKRPDINAVIHTHQPYATGIGLVEEKQIPCNLTTMANATKGAVNIAPYSSAASIDMGIMAVKYLEDKLAVVLKHHGVIAVGDDLKEALYACVYLEEACKTLVAAKAYGRGNVSELNEEQVNRAVEVFNNYGQKDDKEEG